MPFSVFYPPEKFFSQKERGGERTTATVQKSTACCYSHANPRPPTPIKQLNFLFYLRFTQDFSKSPTYPTILKQTKFPNVLFGTFRYHSPEKKGICKGSHSAYRQ